jgi:bifunctional DNA-binding transcriptional regulator/antitoxin component of YhaV-PrlF toxin-antitoxin module
MVNLYRKTQRIRESLFIGIPAEIARQLSIKKGDKLCIDVMNKTMIVAHLPPSKTAGVPTDTAQKEVSADE